MNRLIVSLAVTSVFTVMPALSLAAPRLIDSRTYMIEAIKVGALTDAQWRDLEKDRSALARAETSNMGGHTSK